MPHLPGGGHELAAKEESMTFAIEITPPNSGRVNVAIVTLTRIGGKMTSEVAFQYPPSPEEIEAAQEATRVVMAQAWGATAKLVSTTEEPDHEKRSAIARKFLGGGKG